MGINLPALRLEIQADLIGQELVQQGFTEIRLGNIVYGIESTDQARDLGIDYILKTVYSKKVNKEGYPKSVLPFLLHPQKV